MSVRPLLIALGAVAMAGAARAEPTPGPLADTRLMQITLPVKDLDRSVAFYRDVLGVKVLFVVKGAAFLDAGGGVRLRLEKNDRTAPTDAVEIYFDDPGMARVAPLAARGVKFIGPPETVNRRGDMDVKLAEFTDPDGNAIGLMGEVPHGAASGR
jgi:catechol 2,3-dioxygenase-like lactoylglutathione lyase family enzyme